MANNRKISRLDDLAFRALLRNSAFSISSEAQQLVYMRYLHKLDIPVFLQVIADANPAEVQKRLNDCPELAVAVIGTVTTVSGYTYENVTAVQLAYLMDDDELMTDVLLPAIKRLPLDMVRQAEEQLTEKMKEVEIQQTQFNPYDFAGLVKAIALDETLRHSGQPNNATQNAFAHLIEDFKPGNIAQGKSRIKEQLREVYRVCNDNWDLWSVNQLRWYLINIVGHLQTLVEKCFEQECSQGLSETANHKVPNARGVKINNRINDTELNYRGNADGSLVPGRDYYIEIIYGGGDTAVTSGTARHRSLECLNTHINNKNRQWEKIRNELTTLSKAPVVLPAPVRP
jgi:hypothetical protein